MKLFTTALAAAVTLSALPALAQDAEPMSDQSEKVGNMGKIESNIAEMQARLLTHMLLPADNPEREAYATAFMEDMNSVDGYLAEVQGADLSEDAQTELGKFATEWTEVKGLATGLTEYSRDNLASVEEISAFSGAVIGLDDYIDAALVAAGLPDDDDGPESEAATSN